MAELEHSARFRTLELIQSCTIDDSSGDEIRAVTNAFHINQVTFNRVEGGMVGRWRIGEYSHSDTKNSLGTSYANIYLNTLSCYSTSIYLFNGYLSRDRIQFNIICFRFLRCHLRSISHSLTLFVSFCFSPSLRRFPSLYLFCLETDCIALVQFFAY